ncbi:helix-turn-helix domain-containing protein, partial [Lysobacter sp. 2RAB21]
LALAEGEVLSATDLRLPRLSTQPPPLPANVAQNGNNTPQQSGAVDPRTLNPRDTATSALPSYIEEIERAAIQQALQENRYNKTRTAAALGITFRALRYKLKKLGID